MGQTDSQLSTVGRVAIVGTGLVGGSIGLGLRSAGYPGRIVGVGRRAETVRRAAALGCIDEPTTDLAEAVRGDTNVLVVLATPLGAFEQVLTALADLSGDGVVITDVGSTKEQVCATAGRLLPDPSRFVGSHPMAGGERHGPDQAVADLFVDKPCIVTDEPGTDSSVVAVVESLWRTLRMRPIRMTPAEHDRKAALISHLPHAIAALIVQVACRSDALGLASTGFLDTTRIASGDPNVWLDVFATNRQAMLDAIDAFGSDLAQFRQMLESGDRAGLFDLLARCRLQRDRWGEAFGGENTTKGE